MQQVLGLNWQRDEQKDEGFFVSSSNFDAYNTVINYDWQRLIVIGDSRSGKTTLAKLWQNKRKGKFCCSLYDLKEKEDVDSIIIDDVEDMNENELLNLINYASEQGMPLLILAARYPTFSLIDLRSRLSSTLKVIIKFPDIKLAKKLIFKLFQQKQIRIYPEEVEYIVYNIDRDYVKIEYIVNYIDKMSEALGKKINIKTIREFMAKYSLQNEEQV